MSTSRTGGLDREATFETGSTLTNNDSKSNKSDKAAKGPGFFERRAVGVLTGLARFGSSEKKKIAAESGGDADAEQKAWLNKAARVVAKNNLPGLGLLQRAGADLDAKSSKEHASTAAHYAGFQGNSKRLQQLSDLGADVHATDADGQTPLHHAAAMGHTSTVQKMADLGANLDVTDRNGNTPMHFAAGLGQNGAASTLLANGADPFMNARNAEGQTARDKAKDNGNKKVVGTIDSHEIGRNKRFGISQPAEPEAEAKTPGFWKEIGSTISKHSSQASSSVLANMATRQKGGNLTKQEKLDKALRSAAKSHFFSEFRTKILLNNGARADTTSEYTGKSAMHEAAERNKLGVLKRQTASGQEIDGRSDSNKTALDYAVRKGNKKAADLLLARGADTETTVGAAQRYGHKKLAKRIEAHDSGRDRIAQAIERARTPSFVERARSPSVAEDEEFEYDDDHQSFTSSQLDNDNRSFISNQSDAPTIRPGNGFAASSTGRQLRSPSPLTIRGEDEEDDIGSTAQRL